jgi:predicted MFS family arabinose efflux permease
MLAGSSLAMLALGVVLLDVGIQAAMNGNQSTVLSLASQATSRTNTIYMVIYFVGGALGSYTGGLAWHHFGWPGTTALGLLYSCAAVFVRFAWMPATVPITLTKGDASSLPSSNSSSPHQQRNWKS